MHRQFFSYRQQAEMETLFRKHQREFQRLIMLKKKKRMKSKKELQNLIQMEGAGKVVVAASGEIVNNPSQTSSNDSIERRAPQPSGDPLRSYSDAPLGTQNLSTEVADGSLYKAGYNQVLEIIFSIICGYFCFLLDKIYLYRIILLDKIFFLISLHFMTTYLSI